MVFTKNMPINNKLLFGELLKDIIPVLCKIFRVFILASVTLASSAGTSVIEETTVIQRDASGIDKAFVVTARNCFLVCKVEQSLVLDTENNTVECIGNEWIATPLEYCQINVRQLSTTSKETTSNKKKIGKHEIASVDLRTNILDIQVLYQAPRTKAVYEFPALMCNLRPKYISLQTGVNKTLWSTMAAASSCFKLEDNGGTRATLKFDCETDVLKQLEGHLVKLDLHCVYKFGTSINSVNSCLMFKVIGNHTVHKKMGGLCDEDLGNTKKTQDNNSAHKESESNNAMPVLVGIIILVVAICVVVFFVHRRRKRLKTELACTRSRSSTRGSVRSVRSSSLRSQRTATLTSANGNGAIYEEIRPKEFTGKFTDSEYLEPVTYNGSSSLKNSKDTEYLEPVTYNGSSSLKNGKFRDKEYIELTTKDAKEKDDDGYEMLHPSQQYEPDYELMEINNNKECTL